MDSGSHDHSPHPTVPAEAARLSPCGHLHPCGDAGPGTRVLCSLGCPTAVGDTGVTQLQ